VVNLQVALFLSFLTPLLSLPPSLSLSLSSLLFSLLFSRSLSLSTDINIFAFFLCFSSPSCSRGGWEEAAKSNQERGTSVHFRHREPQPRFLQQTIMSDLSRDQNTHSSGHAFLQPQRRWHTIQALVPAILAVQWHQIEGFFPQETSRIVSGRLCFRWRVDGHSQISGTTWLEVKRVPFVVMDLVDLDTELFGQPTTIRPLCC